LWFLKTEVFFETTIFFFQPGFSPLSISLLKQKYTVRCLHRNNKKGGRRKEKQVGAVTGNPLRYSEIRIPPWDENLLPPTNSQQNIN
jgi:hypothetical protein